MQIKYVDTRLSCYTHARTHVVLVKTALVHNMGRREQKERERRRAAAMSQSLQKFLPPKKKTAVNTEGDAAASGSQTTAATLDSAQKSASSSADLSPDSEVSPGDDTMVFQEPGQGSCPPADIGDIFVRAKSSVDFCSAVGGLTITQKYELLKNHRKPGTNHVFPTQYLGGCNRSFRQVWLTEHPWMVYSELVDGAFCVACAIFSANPSRGKLVTQPFRV